MIKTVLFDYDGTLMDTTELILLSWEEAFRAMGRPSPGREWFLSTFGEPLALSMEHAFPDIPVEEPLTAYRSYNQEHFLDYVAPYEGMVEAIKELRARGVKTGIVTARLKKTTYMGLEKFAMLSLFDAIVTEDQIAKSKPDPEPVFAALRAMGEPVPKDMSESDVDGADLSGQVLMIGDTKHDYHCAKNAGVDAGLVAWASTLERLPDVTPPRMRDRATGEVLSPEHIIACAADIPAIVIDDPPAGGTGECRESGTMVK